MSFAIKLRRFREAFGGFGVPLDLSYTELASNFRSENVSTMSRTSLAARHKARAVWSKPGPYERDSGQAKGFNTRRQNERERAPRSPDEHGARRKANPYMGRSRPFPPRLILVIVRILLHPMESAAHQQEF
jgi:hypothetical protein